MSEQVASDFARRQRVSDWIVVLLGLVAGSAVAMCVWLGLVVSDLADGVDEQSLVVEVISDFVERAECSDRIEAGFERAVGEVLLVDRSVPGALDAARAELDQRTTDLRRVENGEDPCAVVESRS